MTAATRISHGRHRAAAQTAEAGAPLLESRNLSMNFGPIQALAGVTLAVRGGEVVALAGENGAGKTTLVRCIGGRTTPQARPRRRGRASPPPAPAAPRPARPSARGGGPVLL